jgi:sugar/nucleoside kinase (ribokinase family)
MPRLLVVGHVTIDRLAQGEIAGGSVTYAALAARKLGWDVGVLTAAGPEFDVDRELPGASVFLRRGAATTRFVNLYDENHVRRQVLSSRADELDFAALPEEWRDPDVLMLAPVAGEVGPGLAGAFGAEVVGATAQGFLRQVDGSGAVSPRPWTDPGRDLAGVHVVVLSEQDLPPGDDSRRLLDHVPVVALTKGWQGVLLMTRQGDYDVPSLPRPEVDPTGAGDVFAAALLMRYQETSDLLEAAAFACCAASCVVEAVGPTGLGDRYEIVRRLELRERLIDEGEWEE